jgi:hypothetical protein
MSQSIGGVLFGFEQQVWRNVPPPEELVHHARPDGPVSASDGSTYEIRMPEPGEADLDPSAPPHPFAQTGAEEPMSAPTDPEDPTAEVAGLEP